MKVDSHQHYWKPSRNDYGWLTPETGVLYADYMPDQLHPLLQQYNFDRTIVVQAAPTIAETEFLLSLCDKEETLAGVVGWLDLESDGFARDFARLLRNPYFVGIRPMLQDMDDDAYILRPKVIESLKALAEDDFPIDLQLRPRHLPHVVRLFEKMPKLKAVIDHLAKPYIADGTLEPWKQQIGEIARHGNVYCKLSGMVTEARQQWSPADFIPYVHHIVDVFGTDRIMFGSDWPVCLPTEYGEVVKLLLDALPETVTNEDREKLFGSNAIFFYQLKLGTV
ncbi:amidohydrolase family protein [Cohnella silvisoli]|uniref:Amidohydrolase family protein n=1 Tax=Cohnella silvisoli TaxID=2873699 RepID=A0ABV1KWR6_9BACL|nr:amidohydrolase family protein [Cohnella silvisoli]MCD9023619.1 amidohydrolase family protein [Cohnella silvisoli]